MDAWIQLSHVIKVYFIKYADAGNFTFAMCESEVMCMLDEVEARTLTV
jgi:hypothetical protein